jgi:phage terminase large subunit GpA-like protein
MPIDAGLAAAQARGLALPPVVHVDQWAAMYRQIVVGAEPGQWRNERTPYLVEIMRLLTDPRVRDLVLMAASQVGKTEVGINWFLRNIACNPGFMLWVTSTDKQLKKISRARFDVALADPIFEKLVSPKKGRDADRNTYSVAFENGRLNFATSHSPSDLSSDPQRDVCYDEVDRYDLSSQDEGDVIGLGRARQQTFERSGAKSLYISSPAIEGTSRIHQLFLDSDRRYYFVRCHACGSPQRLIFEQVKWRDNDPQTAIYQCASCAAPWHDSDRWAALSPERGAEWVAEAPFRGTAGFHLSQLYSTFVELPTVVDAWLKAQGRVEQLQVFFNTVLGLPWSVKAEAIDSKSVPREQWGGYDMPLDVCLVVAFCDVQGNRIEVSTYGVAPDETLYGVDHTALQGNVQHPDVWVALDQHLQRQWRRQDGWMLGVTAAGIDCGFESDRVIKWANARMKAGRRTFATKGFDRGFESPVVTNREPSKGKSGVFFPVNADASKYQVLQRLKRESGPERFRFPARDCFTDDFFEQLTSEQLVWRYRRGGLEAVLEWQQRQGVRNEALDCAAGAIAVLRWLNPNLAAIAAHFPPLAADAAPANLPPAATPDARQAATDRAVRVVRKDGAGGAWFDR